MTREKIQHIDQNLPKAPTLLIVAHCSTIRRKYKRFNKYELTAILDDFVRELHSKNISLQTYFDWLNEILRVLNAKFPLKLSKIKKHYFYTLVLNTIQNLLRYIYTSNHLENNERYLLRNSIIFISNLVKYTNDISTVLDWIIDEKFLEVLANCLYDINQVLDENIVKHIKRLLSVFCIIQDRLPESLHGNLFEPLLQPVINCLLSTKYFQLFQDLPSNTESLKETEKLYLVKCPLFLTSYKGPNATKSIENVLESMLPNYIVLFDKHMKTVNEWNNKFMRAVHNLLLLIACATQYLSLKINDQLVHLLINHLLNLLDQSKLRENIDSAGDNIETLIVNTILITFSTLVEKHHTLNYVQQLKSTGIFWKLIATSHEAIILNSSAIISHITDNDDLISFNNDISKLVLANVNILGKFIDMKDAKNLYSKDSQRIINNNIIKVVKLFIDLIEFESIRHEILKQDILSNFMNYYKRLDESLHQLLHELLWKLAYDDHNNESDELINNIDEFHSNFLEESLNFEPIVDDIEVRSSQSIMPNHPNYKYDVTVSYCFADIDVAFKIEQFLLNHNFNVWLDRDHYHTQDKKIVENAIDNSEVILICLSDSYQNNDRSRLEAEYILNAKQFIPIIFEKQGEPNEWAKSIIEKNSIVDFRASSFNRASGILLSKINQRKNRYIGSDVRSIEKISTHVIKNSSEPCKSSNAPCLSIEALKSVDGIDANVCPTLTTIDINQQETSNLRSCEQNVLNGNNSIVSIDQKSKSQTSDAAINSSPTIHSIDQHTLSYTAVNPTKFGSIRFSAFSAVANKKKEHESSSSISTISTLETTHSVSDTVSKQYDLQQRTVPESPIPMMNNSTTKSNFSKNFNEKQIKINPIVNTSIKFPKSYNNSGNINDKENNLPIDLMAPLSASDNFIEKVSIENISDHSKSDIEKNHPKAKEQQNSLKSTRESCSYDLPYKVDYQPAENKLDSSLKTNGPMNVTNNKLFCFNQKLESKVRNPVSRVSKCPVMNFSRRPAVNIQPSPHISFKYVPKMNGVQNQPTRQCTQPVVCTNGFATPYVEYHHECFIYNNKLTDKIKSQQPPQVTQGPIFPTCSIKPVFLSTTTKPMDWNRQSETCCKKLTMESTNCGLPALTCQEYVFNPLYGTIQEQYVKLV